MNTSNLLPIALLAGAVAGATAMPTAAANESVMISRFARDTGLSPNEVVMALGERIDMTAFNYYAYPSMRGHLARMTRQAHDRATGQASVLADASDALAVEYEHDPAR